MKFKDKRVVIADDHPLMLRGLRDCLESAGFLVVAAARTGSEALAALRHYEPCLSVLDISMPGMNGLEVATKARELKLECAIILLSIYDDPGYIHRAKEIPVDGYLLKEKATQEVIRVLEMIIKGETYYDQAIEANYRKSVQPVEKKYLTLTRSEQKILLAVSRGETIQEIAGKFFISTRTVEKHRENIRRKLDLAETSEKNLDNWAQNHRKLLSSIVRGV